MKRPAVHIRLYPRSGQTAYLSGVSSLAVKTNMAPNFSTSADGRDKQVPREAALPSRGDQPAQYLLNVNHQTSGWQPQTRRMRWKIRSNAGRMSFGKPTAALLARTKSTGSRLSLKWRVPPRRPSSQHASVHQGLKRQLKDRLLAASKHHCRNLQGWVTAARSPAPRSRPARRSA